MIESKKRKILKTEPKLKVSLNEEQKEFMNLFYEYDVNFLLGDFGSGKSLAAVYAAITSYRKGFFDNIWITRPMLKNELSALPGTKEDKMEPYVFPIVQNLEVCQGKEITDKMLKEGIIKMMPISVAKGVTFINSVVIVDEFQDMKYLDFRTILTRLGKDSKIIFCGSKKQIDSSIGSSSCIFDALKLEGSNLVGFSKLKSNHRNEVLTKIIDYIENEKYKNSDNKSIN